MGSRFVTLDQQVVEVGTQIRVDDEARVRLAQIDPLDVQAARMLVIQAAELQSLPLHEVAVVDGVERMQLGRIDAAAYAEGQRLGTLPVDL